MSFIIMQLMLQEATFLVSKLPYTLNLHKAKIIMILSLKLNITRPQKRKYMFTFYLKVTELECFSKPYQANINTKHISRTLFLV